MNRQTQRHINRMKNVLRAVEEAPKPEDFDMQRFGYITSKECGTPACAFGQYAFRRDLQITFTLNKEGGVLSSWGDPVSFYEEVASHFGITGREIMNLFDTDGCNNAGEDRQQVIAYIKQFILDKWGVTA